MVVDKVKVMQEIKELVGEQLKVIRTVTQGLRAPSILQVHPTVVSTFEHASDPCVLRTSA